MARMEIDGLGGLSLSEILDLPDSVAQEMLLAGAKIVEEAQVYTGMQAGVYRTGTTLRAIRHGKMKRDKNGDRVLHVYPQGKNEQGVRNAEVAFINEYGAPGKNINARQFIRKANELSADPAAEAAARIYNRWLEEKGL